MAKATKPSPKSKPTAAPRKLDYHSMYDDIYGEVDTMDTIDIHTHINWDRPQAQTVVPILFYHFVHFEMLAAGLPQVTDHVRDANVTDVRDRIMRALPYFEKVRFSGSYYCVKRVLQDLYGMKTECPTEKFVDELLAKVEHNKNDKNWPREVLKRAHLKRISINILDYEDWPGKMKANNPDTRRYSDIFYPSIEQGDFVLLDANAAVRAAEKRSKVTVSDAASYAQAIRSFATPEEFDSIKSFLGWATLNFVYKGVDPQLADAAIKKAVRGEPTTVAENTAVQIFSVVTLFEELKKRDVPYQIFFGSEFTPGHLRREPAVCAYSDQTLLHFGSLVQDQKDMRFDLLLGNATLSQEANILVKMYPNLNIGGIWWHNMYPSYIRRLIGERLDVCPVTKVSGFFSDAYCVEWAYGKRKLVMRELAAVLADRVYTGYITRNDASYIARQWLWENPKAFYRV
jgi:glucuronate isomerase